MCTTESNHIRMWHMELGRFGCADMNLVHGLLNILVALLNRLDLLLCI